MTNLYDVSYKKPTINRNWRNREVENLARSLVESGRLRIDADDERNFVVCNYPSIGVSFILSSRELNDEKLLPRTRCFLKSELKRFFHGVNHKMFVEKEIRRLRLEIKKCSKVNPKTEMKIARVVVQSVEPIVMKLFLAEMGEVFVSYSFNIGDLLDIDSWSSQRFNNGMQSIDSVGVAVYVSCCGDPFIHEGDERHQYDGKVALARMMVILGQEFGHYADIKRNRHGHYVSRHSANISATKAKAEITVARNQDIINILQVYRTIKKYGMRYLIRKEKAMDFYKRNKQIGLRYFFERIKHFFVRIYFVNRVYSSNLRFIGEFRGELMVATTLNKLILDMDFNMAPESDAYQRSNPVEENAILCVEALARVPQQVNKWGHKTTKMLIPNLYNIYYNQVIPACRRDYERMARNL